MAVRGRGRPKKEAGANDIPRPYKSPDELKKKMQEYFDSCEMEDDVFPDVAGMRIYLDLGHRSYKSYEDDPDYELVFDWAQDKRESWASRAIAKNPRNSAAYNIILKQPENGGWRDRVVEKGDTGLDVNLVGIGGEEAAK